MNVTPLAQRRCLNLHGAQAHLSAEQIQELLGQLHPDWRLGPHGDAIVREFRFHNFRETILFANVIAWLAEQENHHPELRLRYNTCAVHYRTDDVGGLSENDFICAAKIDTLVTL
ncbi:MAG: 4a-hydroxytetrahydrobiopterin dehydratase [Gammaproteobacteria bacterium]|nr:4a-hydroxytetrahydrobiopterin dehydratase [Gammaproteobacteria bacterium]